jgi:hypothetical protein
VARTQTNNIERIRVFRRSDKVSRKKIPTPLENKVAVISLIAKMLVYSAIKINANRPLLYSTLNPDTNSDSPSAKSNGVRLVSAKLVINHKIAIGGMISTIHERCEIEISVKSKEFSKIKTLIKIKDILTSYEMVCATPRNAPRRAYFEFEHHPAIKVAYTLVLDTHRKNKIPNTIKKDWDE